MTVEELYARQVDREHESSGVAIQKYITNLQKAITQGRLDETYEGQILMKLGYEPYLNKITEYLDSKLRGQEAKIQNGIKMICSEPDKIAYIVLSSVIAKVAEHSQATSLTSIGRNTIGKLKELYYWKKLEDKDPILYSYLGTEFRKASAKRKVMLMDKHLHKIKESFNLGRDASEELRLGVKLVEILELSGANLINITNTRTGVNRFRYEVSITNDALNIILNSKSRESIISSSVLKPMIVPPKDWIGQNDGGYLEHKIPLIKVRNNRHRDYIEEQDLSKVMKVINKLQKTPWRVNKRVADIMYDIYDNNMIDPKSPPMPPTLYGGLPTSEVYTIDDFIDRPAWTGEMTEEYKKEWSHWKDVTEPLLIKLDSAAGKRLNFVLTMAIIQEMMDYDKFYYVYQFDYRGRVYPHSEFYHPQTSGYVKATLEFGEGRKLNSEGLYWLKIHTANCFGLDKEEMVDRVKWFDDNTADILQVAKDPMGNLKLWTVADSPYEYLAACYAYEDYINDKEVHLPIQLDAVNSGVQMYSGLLLDKEGAESCCVIGDKRADLYQVVANKVNNRLAKGDYPKEIEFKDSNGEYRMYNTYLEAKSITGKINRKMTKTNCMTVPYSVTMRGMSEQNWDVMGEYADKGQQFWEGDKFIVNKLLTQLNYECIYDTINGARKGQEYLKEVASLLDDQAKWFTPIYNFPVMQQAWKQKEHRVKTPLGRLLIKIDTPQLDRPRQKSGIAANFVHSIDSTLLLWCVENMSGLIGVIHDCFMVHPNDGEEIRNHYKEGYFEIMGSKPLTKFSEEVDKEGLVEVPCIGDLDLNEVYDSEYIIS